MGQQSCQGTIFLGHIFTQFFEEKKVSTIEHKISEPFFGIYPLIFDHIISKKVLNMNLVDTDYN